MGRKEIRRSKQYRKAQEKQLIQMSDIIEARNKAREAALKQVTEDFVPVFCLYLVKQFHCKEEGVGKFMKWFNGMMEWLESNPNGYDEIQKDLWERANIRIIYD